MRNTKDEDPAPPGEPKKLQRAQCIPVDSFKELALACGAEWAGFATYGWAARAPKGFCFVANGQHELFEYFEKATRLSAANLGRTREKLVPKVKLGIQACHCAACAEGKAGP